MKKQTLLIVAIWMLSGCSADGPERKDIAADITKRTGYALPESTKIGEITLPPGTTIEDGVTEDEAVSIALWNNAKFQETLVNLDIARGDLIQAGLLPNPIGSYSFQVADKPLKYAFELPLEALWLRPIKIDAAEADAERVAHQLSQAGLDLIRDTRKAYGDIRQTEAQYGVAKESLEICSRIAELSQKRLQSGDISAYEADAARLDRLTAEQNTVRLEHEKRVAEERLRHVMGIGAYASGLKIDSAPPPQCREMNVKTIVEEAQHTRPDALAAVEAIKATKSRGHLADFGWLGITGIADATSGRDTGHELGPAIKGTLPVLNQNQGNRTRADAQTEQALRNQQTVAQQILLEVSQAYAQYHQACAELSILHSQVKKDAEKNVSRTQKAYSQGDIPYLMVLESTRMLTDAKMRETQLIGDVRRATAELERSIGRKIAALKENL